MSQKGDRISAKWSFIVATPSNHMQLLDLPTETLERVFLLLHYFDVCNVKLVRTAE